MFGEGKDEVGNIMNQECRIMFREIRKKRNKIEDSAAEELLQNSRRGVLAVNGDDGYPYAIPLNYFYDRENRKIYFHGARAGHKVDALKRSDKVCFTVDQGGRLGTVYAEYGCVREMSFDGKWQ